MQAKTNIKKPDRIILFEIGVILALLFVNWALNFQYSTNTVTDYDTPETLLYDSAYTYNPPSEPELIIEPDPPKPQLSEASIFNPIAIIRQVDDIFKTRDEIIAPITPPGPGLIKPIVVNPVAKPSNEVITFADKMPEFPGGEEALNKFIVDHFDIPNPLYEFAEDVTVVVEFIIDKNGEVTDIKILRCDRPGFGVESEAKSIYANMPKWEAGMNNGQKARVRMRQPIKIQIQ